MNKVSFASIFALLLTLAACGKEPATPTAAQQQPAPTVTADPAANEPAAAADAPAASAEQEQVAAAPVEAISETADEVVDENAAAVRPSLRLGGQASTAAPTSAKFKEGTNYQKLVPAQPTGVGPGKVEVTEVFWYGCAHCYALEPALESWRGKGKPANAEFVRVPAMWNDMLRMHARIFYTAELLGKLDEVHGPIFREIHTKGNQLNTIEKITAFFREHGVTTDEFQKAFSSFAVESKMQRADFLNRRYRIESVPTIVVNGKYKTDVGMAGGEPQLFQLIGELTASESGG
jgi:protein dithiol oxidoreductase (disulfide-forming)